MNKPSRILVVDDERDIRRLLRDILETLGYEVEIARDGFEAMAKLALDIDLVLSDVMMSGMDGFELVKRIRDNPDFQDLPVIIVTGMTTRKDRIRAVEVGANDFVAKPFELTEINVRIKSLLRSKEAHDELKRHKQELEGVVARRTLALRNALDETVEIQRMLRKAHIETINRLVVAAEYKDKGTAGHIQRMSRFSALLAQKINLPPSEIELILRASPMHDIGKIGTPEDILLKPGKLNEDEWVMIKKHPLIGGDILKQSSSDLLRAGEVIALSHHEKWDGSGYPNGLAGEDIPLWGRICAVADVFDALTNERPYKPAYSNEESLRILREGSGKHFDPHLVDIFINSMDEVVGIQSNPDLDIFASIETDSHISVN